MDPIWINAAILPWITVAMIPIAIRDRKTGEYLGFINPNTVFYFFTLLILQLVFMTGKFGMGLEAIVRAVAISILPFPLAYTYVVYTHKQLFGEPFVRNKKKGD
ncbi:MAG: hypothetical protein GKR91_17080 [Pseudomonadales bacterium]|nr:hypothetical protein [Pseudomonadales bacterium]